MRPQSSMGLGDNVFRLKKKRIKRRLILLLLPRQCRRPHQKSPEEREFVVDFGASVHMLSNKGLSSWRSRNPTRVVPANGKVQTNEEAQVFVHDLDLFVTVQVLEDTPAVLSLGKLCEEHGKTLSWPAVVKSDI